MRNSEIHNGLDKADVRDVIAQGLINSYGRESSVYGYSSGTRLEQAAEKLRIAKENYEAIKEQEAFITIMKSLGWEEFDVSDETFKDHEEKFWLSFIGTQEEYEVLIKQLEKE